MPKARKKVAVAPEAPAVPQVGDKVTVGSSDSVYEISRVHIGGDEVDLQFPNTNLMRFRVRTDALKYLERKPPARTSNPFTEAESVLDTDEIMERIATVQQENLERLDGDVDILKSYLKTQHAPKTAIEALEALTVDQHVSWKKAVEKVRKTLAE
jgi:uncharacterized small protein (DUF1192 family)